MDWISGIKTLLMDRFSLILKAGGLPIGRWFRNQFLHRFLANIKKISENCGS